MSDYVHTKSIIYPITKEILVKMNLEDVYNLEEKFPKTDFGKFFIEGIVDYKSNYTYGHCVSLELYSNYEDDAADFSRLRFLTKKRARKICTTF